MSADNEIIRDYDDRIMPQVEVQTTQQLEFGDLTDGSERQIMPARAQTGEPDPIVQQYHAVEESVDSQPTTPNNHANGDIVRRVRHSGYPKDFTQGLARQHTLKILHKESTIVTDSQIVRRARQSRSNIHKFSSSEIKLIAEPEQTIGGLMRSIAEDLPEVHPPSKRKVVVGAIVAGIVLPFVNRSNSYADGRSNNMPPDSNSAPHNSDTHKVEIKPGDTYWKFAEIIAKETNQPIEKVLKQILADNPEQIRSQGVRDLHIDSFMVLPNESSNLSANTVIPPTYNPKAEKVVVVKHGDTFWGFAVMESKQTGLPVKKEVTQLEALNPEDLPRDLQIGTTVSLDTNIPTTETPKPSHIVHLTEPTHKDPAYKKQLQKTIADISSQITTLPNDIPEPPAVVAYNANVDPQVVQLIPVPNTDPIEIQSAAPATVIPHPIPPSIHNEQPFASTSEAEAPVTATPPQTAQPSRITSKELFIDTAKPGAINIKAAKAAGVEGIFGYVNGRGKGMTEKDIARFHEAGWPIGLFYETTGRDALQGGHAGTQAAKAAISDARRLGVPKYVALIPCVDFEELPVNEPAVNAYMRAFYAELAKAGYGVDAVYGGLETIKTVNKLGNVALNIQAEAWSRGIWSHFTNVKQINGEKINGVHVDYDYVSPGTLGLWYPNQKLTSKQQLFNAIVKYAHGDSEEIISMVEGSSLESNMNNHDIDGAFQIDQAGKPGGPHPNISQADAQNPDIAARLMAPRYKAAVERVNQEYPGLFKSNPQKAAMLAAYYAERPAKIYTLTQGSRIGPLFTNGEKMMEAAGLSVNFGN